MADYDDRRDLKKKEQWDNRKVDVIRSYGRIDAVLSRAQEAMQALAALRKSLRDGRYHLQ